MKVRTRFAPSPTGFLHIGGLRTALYNYLFSKQHSGEFILRIEDTDQSRLVEKSKEQLINTLKNFELNFDEGPNHNEKLGPYIQSQRLEIYNTYYKKLLEKNDAYICIQDQDGSLLPEKDYLKAKEKIKNSKYVVKLKIPKNEEITINDYIRGEIKFDLSLIEDPIIIKSDGFPTYHFANVIDDHLMNISHVIRGDEWLPSLPKHIILYKCFEWKPPIFIHLPLLLNADKSKLSKRQGDVHVEDFLKKGYLKKAIINYVAMLGWHPNSNNEVFSMHDLLKTFSIERIQKSGAIFDLKKLNWINSYYLKEMDLNIFQKLVNDYCIKTNTSLKFNAKQMTYFLKYIKNRINALHEIQNHANLFGENPNLIDEHQLILKNESSLKIISYWINHLNTKDDSTIAAMIDYCNNTLNVKGKNLFFPLRILLIGETHGPDLHTIINILGVKESIKRLKAWKH